MTMIGAKAMSIISKVYSKKYSDESFWEKIKKYAKKAGLKVVYVALILYYTLQDQNVPAKAKAVIIGALGYFIFPVDFIIDTIPAVGYSDDVAVLIMALLQVALYVNTSIKAKAREQLVNIFGNIDTEDIKEVDDKLNNTGGN